MLSNRIKIARKSAKLSQIELAELCGWDQGRQSHYEIGRNEPTLEQLSLIAKHTGYSYSVLVGAKGVSESSTPDYNTEPASMSSKTVPIISWIQAGEWSEAMDLQHPNDTDYETVPKIKGGSRVYALRVKGDSMTAPAGVQPSFPEGFIIQVDPLLTVNDGDCVIAVVNDHKEATFKQLKYDGGKPYLKPLNPTHPPIFGEFKIVGKVIGATLIL